MVADSVTKSPAKHFVSLAQFPLCLCRTRDKSLGHLAYHTADYTADTTGILIHSSKRSKTLSFTKKKRRSPDGLRRTLILLDYKKIFKANLGIFHFNLIMLRICNIELFAFDSNLNIR